MQPTLEHIAPDARSSFVWRRFRQPAFEFTWHFHPEAELTLILGGRGQRFVGDSIESFGPGDLVLLGPNLPHTWQSVSPEAGGDPEVESVVIQFDRDFAGGELWRRPEAAGVRRLLDRAELGLVFPDSCRGVPDLMRDMGHRDAWGRVLMLLEVLGELATPGDGADAGRPLSGVAHRLPPRRGDPRRIDHACRLIAERYAGPLEQAEVADAVHLSPSAFSRFFRRMTGRTFVAYVHELRVADACRRLIEGDAAVTEVCFACGFQNLSNFNRVFRRLRGVSPRDYRRRHRAGV